LRTESAGCVRPERVVYAPIAVRDGSAARHGLDGGLVLCREILVLQVVVGCGAVEDGVQLFCLLVSDHGILHFRESRPIAQGSVLAERHVLLSNGRANLQGRKQNQYQNETQNFHSLKFSLPSALSTLCLPSDWGTGWCCK